MGWCHGANIELRFSRELVDLKLVVKNSHNGLHWKHAFDPTNGKNNISFSTAGWDWPLHRRFIPGLHINHPYFWEYLKGTPKTFVKRQRPRQKVKPRRFKHWKPRVTKIPALSSLIANTKARLYDKSTCQWRQSWQHEKVLMLPTFAVMGSTGACLYGNLRCHRCRQCWLHNNSVFRKAISSLPEFARPVYGRSWVYVGPTNTNLRRSQVGWVLSA